MKRTQWLKHSRAGFRLLAMVLILTVAPPRAHADNNPPVIESTAKRFAFTPNQIS